MKSKYSIQIPKPCHENWDEMSPNAQGKFCGSCQKNVIDFTNKSAVEIQNYLWEHKKQGICGRFEQTQLSRITIQIPQQILWNQVHFHKMFLLALLLTMGTSLFSCADSNGNKHKIDKVEVVDKDDLNRGQATLGMVRLPDSVNDETDSIRFPPTPKKDEIIFKKPAKLEKPQMLTGIVELHPKDSINPSED